MAERTISPRPSLEQVMAIVSFMEKHPALGLGHGRGMERRDECKKLWRKLTQTVNGLAGPTRTMKSWIKFWADKKSTVRSKVVSSGGDPNILKSNIEKKIWDLFLADDLVRAPRNSERKAVKQEAHFIDEALFEGATDHNESDDAPTAFSHSLLLESDAEDVEDRQETAVMDKLVKVMSSQAEAVTQLAQAARVNAQAMERLAEASHIQARAVERLAGTFEAIGGATLQIRTALMDIDATMKQYYTATT